MFSLANAARLSAALGVCALASACVPAVYTSHDGVHGRVVDARTRRPLAGAEIVIHDERDGSDIKTGKSVASARSGADGVFSVPARKRVALLIAGSDFGDVHDVVVVGRAGYRSWSQPLARNKETPDGPDTEDLGTVALKPAGR